MKARDNIALYTRELRHKKGISKKYAFKYGGPEPISSGPWVKTYRRIKTRCIYDKNSSYYKRGVKCEITISELKILWFRDEASKLKQPSIDRKNSRKDYTFDNCRYIELSENLKRKKGEV